MINYKTYIGVPHRESGRRTTRRHGLNINTEYEYLRLQPTNDHGPDGRTTAMSAAVPTTTLICTMLIGL